MSNRKIVASEFEALKAKVKAEMQRRRGINPLTDYASETYDYTIQAKSNNPLMYEHVEKNHTPLSKITLNDIPNVMDHVLYENEMQKLETRVDAASKIAATAKPGDCTLAVCSGLCYSGCYTACTSCTGCSGCTSCTSCSGCGGCSGSCSGSCRGDCDVGCTGCSGTCTGRCDVDCTGCTNCVGCNGCMPCHDCRGCNGCADTCGRGCEIYCSDCAYGANIN